MRALVKDREKKNVITVTVWSGQEQIYLNLELTFAGLESLKPPVTNVSVTGTSTILKPSTARSTTTGSAGFLEHAAP